MMTEIIKQPRINPAYFTILSELSNGEILNIWKISRKTGISYDYTFKMIKKLAKINIIFCQKSGRQNIIKKNPKFNHIYESILYLKEMEK